MYNATFYDRSNGTVLPAQVTIAPFGLEVALQFEHGFPKKMEWPIKELNSARDDNGMVIIQRDRMFVEIVSDSFRTDFERQFPSSKLFRSGFLDRLGVKTCLILLLLLILPLIAFFKWGLSGIADQIAQKVSPQTEKQIGDALFLGLTANYHIDSSKTVLAQAFYDSLGYGGDYDIRITVVNESTVNAFAVPGGQIVVFDSIIGIMRAPEELAALFAHEASHVHLKHSVRSIFREMALNVLLSMVIGNYDILSGTLATQGKELAGLSYSREFEIEADDNGFKLMQKSQLPLKGMTELFGNMQQVLESETASEMPNFLSTHPSLASRKEIAEEKIIAIGGNAGQIKPSLAELFQKIKVSSK